MTEIPQKEKKVEVITANSNPRIKELNKLNKDAKLRKDRDVFVVEGIRHVQGASASECSGGVSVGECA